MTKKILKCVEFKLFNQRAELKILNVLTDSQFKLRKILFLWSLEEMLREIMIPGTPVHPLPGPLWLIHTRPSF